MSDQVKYQNVGFLTARLNCHVSSLYVSLQCHSAVKFLNFQKATNFTVNTKIQTKWFYHGVTPPVDTNGLANSEDPDHTAF